MTCYHRGAIKSLHPYLRIWWCSNCRVWVDIVPEDEVVKQPNTTAERCRIALEIIRKADTIAILTCPEVNDIFTRALAGEFDDHLLDNHT